MNTIDRVLAGKSASATYLTMLISQLKREGLSEEDIMQALSLKDLSTHEEQRLDFKAMVDYWHAGIKASNNPLLSIASGTQVHPSDFGVLGLLAMNCKNVGDAFERAYKFQRLVGDGFISHIDIEGDVAYNRMDCLDLDPEWTRPYVEQDFIAIIQIGHFLTANLFKNIRFCFHFRHSPAAPISAYQQLFDADYCFNMERDQIVMPRKALDWPLYSPNKDLLDLLTKKAVYLFSRVTRTQKFSHRVREYIEYKIPLGAPSQEDCADYFKISTATFKRRLANEFMTYQQICDEVRLGIACKMLDEKNIKVSDIAVALNYSSLSAFTRFFKRMTEQTPLEYRQRKGL